MWGDFSMELRVPVRGGLRASPVPAPDPLAQTDFDEIPLGFIHKATVRALESCEAPSRSMVSSPDSIPRCISRGPQTNRLSED